MVDEIQNAIANWAEVNAYREQSKNRSDLDRKSGKEKTGVILEGVQATNPADPRSQPLPVFIADYVLMDYGTGSIMAVPAHDERDFEYAKKFDLPIVVTVTPAEGTSPQLPFVSEHGFIILNDRIREFLGARAETSVTAEEMKNLVVTKLAELGKAEPRVTYRIRDWLFSRQRYWGEPVPLVHCNDGTIEGIVKTTDAHGVAEKLPLQLPEVPDYMPSADGYSPLAKNTEWVSTTDSKGDPAQRETNTMPNWAGSCWYYMRYTDPRNDTALAAPEKLKYWLPVDRYFGGSEHTTLHLLYSRFWHRFLYDQGVVPTAEPYAWRMNGGILLGPDAQKMSKSIGNVVNPDDKVNDYGADALRLYISFMGPYDGTLPWSESGLKACRKLVDRIVELANRVEKRPSDIELERNYHKLVKRVGSMLDHLKSNTVVSEIMIFVRTAEGFQTIGWELWCGFLKVIAPIAPFIAEELWQRAHGHADWSPEKSVHLQAWPRYDEALAKDEVIVIGVQVNGKLRDQVEVTPEEDEGSVKERVLASAGIQKWVAGKEIKKFVYVKGRIVNVVVAE
jgi:leucyl-tRNA synthetase